MFLRPSIIAAIVALVFSMSFLSSATANGHETAIPLFTEVEQFDYGGNFHTTVYTANVSDQYTVNFLPIDKSKIMVILLQVQNKETGKSGGAYEKVPIVDVMLL